MSGFTRRSVLGGTGAALAGLAGGAAVSAVAESSERFLVDARHASTRELSRAGLDVVHDLAAIDVAVVRGAESAVRRVTRRYAPDHRYAIDLPVDAVPVPASAADEPLFGFQWDKEVQDVPAAHEVTRGEGTRVAVVDTGVAAGHPDLAHAVNVGLSLNFTDDDYGAGGPYGGFHGTHVAGIVAANDENGAGVAGTAPATEVVDCRVFSPGALASFADIVAAMVYSASVGCDAANMSIGAYPVSRRGLGAFYGMVLNRTTAFAKQQGTLLVASAGNDAADLQHDGRVCVENDDGETECFPAISLPNEAANVVSVSATGPIGFRWGDAGLREPFVSPAFYTNFGTNAVDLAAPGGDADLAAADAGVPGWFHDLVLSTVAEPAFDDDGDFLGATYSYNWAAGTSMAAPQVTGAAALVASADPSATANQVRQALRRTAAVPDGFEKTFYGSGFLNPNDAVRE